jgi:Na+/melibiose symporter-like transporter
LTFFIVPGAGIANSLSGKNLAFFKLDKKALLMSGMMVITTVLLGGFSIFGEKLINPDGYTLKRNEEYYKYKYSSRTYIYFTFGFFSIPIGTIIFLLLIVEYKKNKSEALKEEEPDKKEEMNEENNIKNTEKDYENEIDNNKTEEGDIIIEKELKTMNKTRNLKKIIKTLRFWRLSFIQFLITFSFSFILGTGRTFGALIGIDGNVLQFLMLLQSFALVLVGPILGIFVDKKGPLNLLRIGSLICMIPGLLLTFLTRNTLAFTVSFVISVLALITIVVCFAPFIMEVYGIQESVILGGIMSVFSKLSEVITTVVAFVISLFYSKDEIITPYQIMYITGVGCCLLSFVLLMFESMEKHKYEEDGEDLGNLVANGRFTEALNENA